MRQSKNGFTIVELIVVIVIISILTTVMVFGYTQFIEKAKFSNNQSLIDDIVNTIQAIEIEKNDMDIRKLTKNEFISLYNKYHFRWLNTNRFYNLGLDANSNLLIIVLYKDLYTVYNYDTRVYTNHKEEFAVANLIVGPEEEVEHIAFGKVTETIPLKLFLITDEETQIKCYLYQDEEYTIYFHQDLIDGYLEDNSDKELKDVEDIISSEIDKKVKTMNIEGEKTLFVYLCLDEISTYAVYHDRQEIGKVSRRTLKII